MNIDMEDNETPPTATEVETDDKIGFNSRPYQESIIELVLKRNSIIFLPTGAGKTYIALQTIMRMSKDTEKPLAEGGRRSVFLTNTVVLAKQQAQWIGRLTPLRTASYTGDMDLDLWSQERWVEEFDKNQVLVATCQIVLDVIKHGFISISQLNIIVFDECHNATRNHPMTQLMAAYNRLLSGGTAADKLPRIIGMSGTLLGSQVRSLTVLSELQRLEDQFHATITTVCSTEQFVNVLIFSTKPAERLINFDESKGTDTPMKLRIIRLVEMFLKIVEGWPLGTKVVTSKTTFRAGQVKLSKVIRSIFVDFQYHMDELGMYGASLSIMSALVELEMAKRNADSTIKRQLCRQAIVVAERIRHLIVQLWQETPVVAGPSPTTVATSTDVEMTSTDADALAEDIDSAEIILTESSSKVLALIGFLCEHIRNHSQVDQLKCLIFVKRRQSAKLLYHLLKNYAAAAPERFPLRPDFMVGNNNALSESIQMVLENRWNAGVLDRFKRGLTNVIVATSVLEEGVDLQMCNLVISYDAPESYRSYVQSKGRARMTDSTYVILVPRVRHHELVASLFEFQQVERLLRHYLIGKAIDRPAPLVSSTAHYHAQGGSEMNVPLLTASGAVVNGLAAVALLNRYCMTLPTDQFSKPLVVWQMDGVSATTPSHFGQFRVLMRLPMQSPVKDTFVSDWSNDVLTAKRSAALRACRRLHECGELDDHLLPFTQRRIVNIMQEKYATHWRAEPFANDDALLRASRSKRLQRQHPIVWPDALIKCTPTPSGTALLYGIHLQPSGMESISEAGAFYKLLGDTSCGFGILTAKPLPPCAAFHLHSVAGPMRVHIDTTAVPIDVSDKQSIEQLRRFHAFVFRDVLNIVMPFFAADNDNLENSWLIVPTRFDAQPASKLATIDWKLVHQFQQPVELFDGDAVAADPMANFEQRQQVGQSFRADEWAGRVVFPWYRMDTDRRYVVVHVREHLTPFSPFPNDAFASYAAYIEDKYHLRVACREQFMLEVQEITGDRIGEGLNALVRGEPKKKFASRGIELLIPELCQNFAFPGGMWLKATLLPSVLHRVQSLQTAEALRVELNAQLTVPLSPTAGQPSPVAEQMNRNPPAHKDPDDIIPMRTILIPNPEEAPVHQLAASDFVSISKTAADQWHSQMEPIDLSRHMLKTYSFELDYHFNFINDRFGRLSLNQVSASDKHYPTVGGAPMKAIRIGPDAQKPTIKMLTLDGARESRGLGQAALLAALTAPVAKDVHDNRRQAVLGSACIRFALAVQLLHDSASDRHVGWLQAGHQLLCGTRNLAYCGLAHGLAGRMCVQPFAPLNSWAPPLIGVPRCVQAAMRSVDAPAHSLFRLQLSDEERSSGNVLPDTLYAFVESFLHEASLHQPDVSADDDDDTSDVSMSRFIGVQSVSDSAVADTIRAVCGECARSVGLSQTLHVLRYFGVLPAAKDGEDDLLLSTGVPGRPLRAARLTVAASSDAAIDTLLVNRCQLEKKLGYQFRDRGYLLQALTHPSFIDNPYTDCNQALAFLGDSLCDWLLTAHISESAENLASDELRDLRAAITANISFACYATRAGWHGHLLHSNQALIEKIAAFVTFQEQHDMQLNDRVLLLVEETDVRMGEFVDVPAALGDMFAALIAAVWLDCGGDAVRVWQCLWRLVCDDVERLVWHVPKDVVRQLEEFPGAKPSYQRPFRDMDVVMVDVRFTRRNEVVLVHGFGETPAAAKVAAAKVALHALLQ